jgi:hypothetical protein
MSESRALVEMFLEVELKGCCLWGRKEVRRIGSYGGEDYGE